MVARTVDANPKAAYDVVKRFEAAGLSLDAVTEQVLQEGVVKFDEAFDQLLAGIEKKRKEVG